MTAEKDDEPSSALPEVSPAVFISELLGQARVFRLFRYIIIHETEKEKMVE